MIVGRADGAELRLRDLERAVMDAAEQVAHGRRSGNLTTEALDTLASTHADYARMRHDYLRMV